jgi:hypothetical protein
MFLVKPRIVPVIHIIVIDIRCWGLVRLCEKDLRLGKEG